MTQPLSPASQEQDWMTSQDSASLGGPAAVVDDQSAQRIDVPPLIDSLAVTQDISFGSKESKLISLYRQVEELQDRLNFLRDPQRASGANVDETIEIENGSLQNLYQQIRELETERNQNAQGVQGE